MPSLFATLFRKKTSSHNTRGTSLAWTKDRLVISAKARGISLKARDGSTRTKAQLLAAIKRHRVAHKK